MTIANVYSKVRGFKRRNYSQLVSFLLIFVVGLGVYASYMSNTDRSINPSAFAPLLDLIAKGESNGNYNAYFGNARNDTIEFTSMSVAEVQEWQKDYVANGSPSSAVGRYQTISTTLSGLVDQLGIDPSEKFDKAMQDRMAIALLERRGARDYVNNRITREEFAANLAKEWAALPKVLGDNPSKSYYASDGLNKSRVAVSDVLRTLERVRS